MLRTNMQAQGLQGETIHEDFITLICCRAPFEFKPFHQYYHQEKTITYNDNPRVTTIMEYARLYLVPGGLRFLQNTIA